MGATIRSWLTPGGIGLILFLILVFCVGCPIAASPLGKMAGLPQMPAAPSWWPAAPTPQPKGFFGTGVGPDINPKADDLPKGFCWDPANPETGCTWWGQQPTAVPPTPASFWSNWPIVGSGQQPAAVATNAAAPVGTPTPKATATPKPTATPKATATPLPQRLGEVKVGSPKLTIQIDSCTFPFRCGGNGSLTVKNLEIYQGKVALVADVQFKGAGENYLWTEGGTFGPTVLKVNGTEMPAQEGQANINLPVNTQLTGIRIWFTGSLDPQTLGNGTQISLQAPWLKGGQGTIK